MKIIALCGKDRIGKTTHGKLLAKKIGWTYIKFPNEELYSGKIIRSILNQEMPFEAASFQALQDSNKRETIRRLDPNGKYIFDRFKLSEIVYGLADGLDEDWVRDNAALLPEPDFTLVFCGTPYGIDDDIYGENEYQDKVSKMFAIEGILNDYEGILVDGKSIDEIHDEILARLPEGLL
jgi:dTMP kinase